MICISFMFVYTTFMSIISVFMHIFSETKNLSYLKNNTKSSSCLEEGDSQGPAVANLDPFTASTLRRHPAIPAGYGVTVVSLLLVRSLWLVNLEGVAPLSAKTIYIYIYSILQYIYNKYNSGNIEA